MKTPRDILLARHAGAESKLESMSDRLVAGLHRRSEPAAGRAWLDWFWPRPYAWGTLAAAWIVVAMLHVTAPDVDQPAGRRPLQMARSAETERALLAQKRLLAELAETPPPEPADRRPRSAIRPQFQAG